MSGASADLECHHHSNAAPSLRLQPIATLLRTWPPRETKQPPSVSTADGACSFACNSAPLIDFEILSDRCRALAFLDAKLPFVIRNVPGSRNLAALWTVDYLREHLAGGKHSQALTLNAFEGDEYKAGYAGNRRVSIGDESLWWADWAADRKLPSQPATQAARKRRSFLLEATSTERPFLFDDLAPILYSQTHHNDDLPPASESAYSEASDRVSDAGPARGEANLNAPQSHGPTGSQRLLQVETTRRLLFIPDPSVSARSDVNCRFGFRGTRVEVRTPLKRDTATGCDSDPRARGRPAWGQIMYHDGPPPTGDAC